ncbi:hypothetical protein DFP93_12522 [Aneurinibacillus soli]|uniref:Uncharacterized protein n=1 Tax=Aneurinibacillus soli TaxID=1500254 RepID=A0A0U4NGP0_9BACL|nr:hypothetical protein [Aneurinibacillus soli]PYE58176.1 hypothetical protein DFP93_12522 [Aneurinibacillus soli]BAU27892.1 hypothetical protein CB4_02066 [Aneurinibacillus soli]
MGNKKKRLKKTAAVLSAAAAFWTLSMGSASAYIDAYITKNGDKIYYYSLSDLLTSYKYYLADETSNDGKLWEYFTKSSGSIVAVHDSYRGYLDYTKTKSAYTTSMDLDYYTEHQAPLYESVLGTAIKPSWTSSGIREDGTITLSNSGNLIVTSATVKSATTVDVELSDTPSQTPSASSFNVIAGGQTVTVSSVAKVGTETRKYTLTIPTLTGKEGLLTVNGRTASLMTNSDFSYDYKAPSIYTAEALSASQVKVTFTEKVDKTTAETLANYTLQKASGDALDGAPSGTKTPSSAVLQSDGKTVLLTALGTFVAGTNANKVIISNVKDTSSNVIASSSPAERTFTTTADTTPPQISQASYNKADGKLTLTFTEPVTINASDMIEILREDGTSFSPRKTLAAVTPQSSNNNTVFTFTLSDTELKSTETGTLRVKISKDVSGLAAVTDLNQNSAAKTGDSTPVSVTVTGDTSYPTLTQAGFDKYTGILTLTFDRTSQIINPAMVTIADANTASGFNLWVAGMLPNSIANPNVTLTITGQPLLDLKNMAQPYILIQKDNGSQKAIVNVFGNSATKDGNDIKVNLTVVDTTPSSTP